MITNYDPNRAPDAAKWLRTDEDQRHDIIRRYHRRENQFVGQSERLHVAVHVIVENQIALGEQTAVPRTVERLMREGLDRHEAIHAVGTVLMSHMTSSLRDQKPFSAETYDADLDALTAESWRSLADDLDTPLDFVG